MKYLQISNKEAGREKVNRLQLTRMNIHTFGLTICKEARLVMKKLKKYLE